MFGCLVAHTSYRGEGLFSTPKSLSYYTFSAISQVIKSFRCFYNYQVKYGRPQTLGAQRFSWLPEHVLRELFLRAKPTPTAHTSVLQYGGWCHADHSLYRSAATPPLLVRRIVRCTVFGRSIEGCPLRVALALIPRGGWCPGGTIHPGGPAPPRPPVMPWPVQRWGAQARRPARRHCRPRGA